MVVGGALVFVGLAFLVEWVWDKRKTLPVGEYVVVLAILAAIAAKGFLFGVEVGLLLAIVLFAINYGRTELVHEVAFGATYHSNVDRPPGERDALRELGSLVQILRVSGYVFFGTASGLLERIRKRVERGSLRYLLVDLRRVTGMDSSAAMSFRKVAQLAQANGFELVFTDVPDQVMTRLQRGGVVAADGVVRFEPTWIVGCSGARTASCGVPGLLRDRSTPSPACLRA
jgi:SulP family sulfate permease